LTAPAFGGVSCGELAIKRDSLDKEEDVIKWDDLKSLRYRLNDDWRAKAVFTDKGSGDKCVVWVTAGGNHHWREYSVNTGLVYNVRPPEIFYLVTFKCDGTRYYEATHSETYALSMKRNFGSSRFTVYKCTLDPEKHELTTTVEREMNG